MTPPADPDQQPGQQPSLTEMVAAITKTFAVSHADDSDERLAQALVFNAGRLAWRLRESRQLTTEYKTSVSDVVTDADRAAEQFVAGTLELLRPADGVLGEEGTARASTSGKTWVIDPVDGTYNFTSGMDYWCSALALVEGDPAAPERLRFGAVHRPAMGDTWFGGPKLPSTLNGTPLTPLADAPLNQLSLSTYLHPTWLANRAVRAPWLRVSAKMATLRMLGAGSIDLAQVAQGNLGLWLQHTVADWDWLPGKALIEGVGGRAVKAEAGGVTWCVAGNAAAVAQAVAALGECPTEETTETTDTADTAESLD